MPTSPLTFHERYRGGRKASHKAYNRARANDPHERALHTARWGKVREAALRRDLYQCQECKKLSGLMPVRATQVHHIIKRKDRPDLMFSEENLMSVCARCHARLERE